MAPWLTIDGDAYPAVVDGRIQWIVDAYTTSNGYPYASRTTLGDTTADSLTASNNNRAVVAQQNQVNYIRNSVKATVDAYTGQVKLYQWDTKDPVLKTWMKAFPGTVKPKADISSALMAHLRYPQDLFKVQRELLTRYHVTDAQTFLSGSEVWQVPDDPTNKSGSAVPPYYLSMKMPDQSAQAFSLTTTFTPNGRDNLSAFMAVDSEAGTPDYGKIRILKLPTSTTVGGPKQVQSAFNSQQDIAESIKLLKGGDSDIEYGNLLTVPLDGDCSTWSLSTYAVVDSSTRSCARCWWPTATRPRSRTPWARGSTRSSGRRRVRPRHRTRAPVHRHPATPRSRRR